MWEVTHMTATHLIDLPLKRRILLVLLLLAMFTGLLFIGQRPLHSTFFPDPTPAPSITQHPAATLALSAYLEDTGDRLRPLMIVGWVESAKDSEREAKVKLTLRRLKKDFRQTQLLPVKQGKFEAPYVLGFTAIDQHEPIHITAEAWVPDASGNFKRFTEEIYLNARSPLFSRAAFYPLLLAIGLPLLGVFLWAFTGHGSPLKNRLAIIFSHVITIVFLALPLLAPVVLLMTFPEALDAMKRTPVGLVVTKTTPEPEALTQWALNIGGHVPLGGEQPNSDVVEVQGGLIIPLYVIILSVIGGAINMTRQVPKFQEESEAVAPKVSTPANAIRWRTGLLNQYMFLISASFLAIATYYMLIGLSLTKVPVMVLVAFSVGLISEPILRTITDTAVRFLRQQPPSEPVPPTRRSGEAPETASVVL
jgi:hypothetical protein